MGVITERCNVNRYFVPLSLLSSVLMHLYTRHWDLSCVHNTPIHWMHLLLNDERVSECNSDHTVRNRVVKKKKKSKTVADTVKVNNLKLIIKTKKQNKEECQFIFQLQHNCRNSAPYVSWFCNANLRFLLHVILILCKNNDVHQHNLRDLFFFLELIPWEVNNWTE